MLCCYFIFRLSRSRAVYTGFPLSSILLWWRVGDKLREKPECLTPTVIFCGGHFAGMVWVHFQKSGVHPSRRVPETCRINAKAHWSCSGSTWWPNTLLRNFGLVFPLICHPSVHVEQLSFHYILYMITCPALTSILVIRHYMKLTSFIFFFFNLSLLNVDLSSYFRKNNSYIYMQPNIPIIIGLKAQTV